MSNYSNNELNNAIETFYNTRNKIIVYADTGANITASCKGVTLTATEIGNSGVWYFYYTDYGTWNIQGTRGQYQGSDSIVINELKDYTVNLDISSSIDPVLENSSWQDIQTVAQSSLGSSYWSIGDSKTVVLNGTVKSITFNNHSVKAFIIGFDHNSNVEGVGIHFQIGRSLGDIDICFCDSRYDTEVIITSDHGGTPNPDNYFTWGEVGQTPSGSTRYLMYGWSKCNIRNNILGQDLDNKIGFLNALPSNLVDCIKLSSKYSTNDGLSTNNLLFLLSAFEIRGFDVGSDYTIYQRTYDYYKTGNWIKYMYNNTGSPAKYFLRDAKPTSYSVDGLVYIINTEGVVKAMSEVNGLRNHSEGISFAFVIG